MQVAVFDKKEKVKIIDLSKPEIDKDEALLKLNVCGVCGSDLVKIKNHLVDDGTVLGHEVVGTIVELGKNVKNWSVDQKVVVAHHVPCMSCHFCKSGNFSMCDQFKSSNITPGGFAEYIKISKKHLDHTTFLIPKGTVSDYEISLTEPLACCLRAIQRAQVTASNLVLICGLGSIGIMLGKLCSQKGARTFGLDMLDERIILSKEMNAIQEGFLPNSSSVHKWVSDKTEGRGFDIVFLASGNKKSMEDSLKLVRPGGKVIVFSSISPESTGFLNNDIYFKEFTIMGSYSPSPMTLKESYQMIITGKIKLKKIITDIVKLKDLSKEIDKCFNNQSLKMMVEL